MTEESNSRLEYALNTYKRWKSRIFIKFKHNSGSTKAADYMIAHPQRFVQIKGSFCLFYAAEVDAFVQINLSEFASDIEVIPPADIKQTVEQLTEFMNSVKPYLKENKS